MTHLYRSFFCLTSQLLFYNISTPNSASQPQFFHSPSNSFSIPEGRTFASRRKTSFSLKQLSTHDHREKATQLITFPAPHQPCQIFSNVVGLSNSRNTQLFNGSPWTILLLNFMSKSKSNSSFSSPILHDSVLNSENIVTSIPEQWLLRFLDSYPFNSRQFFRS